MKRTQLYIEEDVWKVLAIRAKQSHSTISDLVRQTLREKYLNGTSNRKEALLAGVGLWKDRNEIPAAETYIRRLRKDDRLERIRK